MIVCKMCDMKFKSNRSLGIHIAHTHKMSTKSYYDLYLKQDNEGKCLNENCQKPTKFLNITKGYRKFCSKYCCNASEYHQTKMQNTIISRYGGMGTSSTIINNKIKKTNIEKYGAENLYASDYGKNKINETSRKKYGTKWPSQSDVVKDKIKQVSLDKYGTINPGNSRQARQKASMTMRQNGNDSSWEDYFEQQCIKYGIKYERRYDLDPRYPYQCDFYLSDSDTFVEINGYWSHGKHFFDENNQNDLKTLSKWKQKADLGHKQYKNAIYVWTVKDQKKLHSAIANKLNYKVLWTYEDMIEFFNNRSK